jgi:DNA-binding CsgD family transcriptional regulator
MRTPTNLKTDIVLTPAETRVAMAYVLGDIGKEVGVRLNIAYNTVVRHTQNIYDKAGIRRSTNALVAWFLAENCGIDLRELARRAGAGFLAIIVCTTIFFCSDDMIARRARRGRRRTEETEWII